MHAYVAMTMVLVAIAAAGCETTPGSGPTQGNATATPQTATRDCAPAARTGSNMLTRECAAPQSEAERQKAMEDMRVKNPSTSTVKSTTGG